MVCFGCSHRNKHQGNGGRNRVTQARPLILRLSPSRLQFWLLHRYYLPRRERWLPLYENAALRDAPGVCMHLIPGDVLSDRIAFAGHFFEHALSRRVIELGRAGGVMVDVGANLGYFSLLWASRHPANRVVAFEAAARNVETLRANVSRNGMEDRISIIPCAAAAEAGVVRFDPGPEQQRGWGGISMAETASSYEVKAVRVDEIVPEDTAVALLKVDTEGADTLVLMGCERLLKKGRIGEIWYEENWARREALGIPAGEAQRYLESMGYRVRALDKERSEFVAVRSQS